jgi:FtsP/CotA-like multicopper oxidase with cupredoxin domain
MVAAPPPQPGASARQPSLQPETITSKDGVLKLDLVVDYNKDPLTIGKDTLHLRTYNGKLVAPVLRAKAGDTLSITVHNKLSNVPPPTPGFMNGHHDWNVTNLHFHGLHVAPQGTPEAESDNVLLEILPQTSQHYEVHIPKDHPAGTFWYHPHRHGSTTAHVASGMAGALIIERTDNVTNLDSIPEVAAAAQEVMVLQAVPYLKNTDGVGDIELANANNMFSPGDFFALKRYITVNGLKIPTITLAPGEVRRLRLVATGQREFVQLRIARDAEGNIPAAEQIPFHEVATDGLVTGRLTQKQDLELQPGYRSDSLIQAPKNASGTYYLVDMNSITTTASSPTDPRPTGADGSPERISIIAMIKIAGAPVDMNLPDPAALMTQRLPDLQDSPDLFTQHAYYGIVSGSGGVKFYLTEADTPAHTVPTGREFDPTETRYLPLGHVEKWQVGSRNSAGIGVAHPFHIHINPFLITQVLDANGQDVLVKEFGGSVWRDTLAMKQDYTYTLLTKYEVYTGRFVNHCHILDHEDNGMMEIVEVYDPAKTQPLSAPLGVAAASGAGNGASAVLRTTPGKPTLAVVVRSVDCGLCREQIAAFEKAAQGKNWPKDLDLVFVAPDTPDRIATAKAEGLVKRGRLVSDTAGATLKSIDPTAMSEDRGHGILLLDRQGDALFKSASTEPLLDPTALKPHFELLAASTAAAAAPAGLVGAAPNGSTGVSIDVWNTPATTDDYVTWAPTPCTIRLNAPAAQDVTVTLTNDPEGPIPSGRTTPLDGDVAFASKLAQGQTAKDATITLTLPKDGSAVPFFIAGKFPRASTKDKDCVVEIHEGQATGAIMGTQALMVRVRKNHLALTDTERARFLSALDYLHRTAQAPEGGDMYMHYVRMHKAAAYGLFYAPGQADPPYPWPDLAHKGPGFISWHRAFLLAFERTIQETHPDVALPYWTMSDPSTLFSPDFLGSNLVNNKGSTPAIFSTTNPLYGWTADIDGAVNQQLVRRGYGRNPGDPRFGPFLKDSDLFTLTPYSYYPLNVDTTNMDNPVNSFAAMLEQNPHNVGHNWIGPWMANCQTSPRDPIFWVFHTGFDRQWAKWQLTKDRFNPDGSGDSFCPKGTSDNPGKLCDPENPPPAKDCNTLDPNACVPVNHHLDDELWPWNQKFGKGTTVKNSYPAEEMAKPFLKPFDAAPIPGLFPAKPQAVTNGDMIDFMAKTPNRLPMGFCYDDTPYDKADLPAPQSLPVVLAAAAPPPPAPKGTLDVQEAATSLLTAPAAERAKTVTRLKGLQDNPKADLSSRRSAMRMLTQRGEADIPFNIAQSTDAKDASLKPEAIRLLSEFMMFHPDGLKRKEEVMKILEKSLDSADQETRSEVLWALAGPEAPEMLVSSLRDSLAGQKDAKFPVEEAIHGLVASGAAEEAAELIRPLLQSKDPAQQAAAASALSRDAGSVDSRVALARNAGVPKQVRVAALQSLDPADSAQFSQVIRIATAPGQDALRGDALAQLGVWARSTALPLSNAQLTQARDALAAITDAGSSGIEATLSQTLRSFDNRLSQAP